MKTKILSVVLLAAALCGSVHAARVEGWILSGARAGSYEIGEDAGESRSNKMSRFIRYTGGDASSFGTLMQQISAKNYQGKRVRFQAIVKTRDVSSWAGLWMSALRSRDERPDAFYNSQDKPIAGTTDWQLRSVTLDIPEDATVLNFGVINAGKGQVWIDELSLEVVGKDVPVDVMPGRSVPAEAPTL
ncbi:transcriptional regulator [Duganella radicis]|uniref:Transcriptional regulator n=1 Tax=Duganella radicis TaxID=551988 RepID=A0A6L6PPY7_9BURK|nr:transcriptional regulator [Duganella radicis]MTV41120.1 transcriptional regulator [Duganella radicis]